MNTHKIQLLVEVTMDEMDGTSEQSAEIAMNLVQELIADSWDANAEVSVISHQ